MHSPETHDRDQLWSTPKNERKRRGIENSLKLHPLGLAAFRITDRGFYLHKRLLHESSIALKYCTYV